MKNRLGKILILGVIFIFLGVTFAPSLNAISVLKNKVSNTVDAPIRFYFCKIDLSGYGEFGSKVGFRSSLLYLYNGSIKITALFSLDLNNNIHFNEEFIATKDTIGITTFFYGMDNYGDIHGYAFCFTLVEYKM